MSLKLKKKLKKYNTTQNKFYKNIINKQPKLPLLNNQPAAHALKELYSLTYSKNYKRKSNKTNNITNKILLKVKSPKIKLNPHALFLD